MNTRDIQLGYLQNLRKKIDEIFAGRNTVDKLIRDKLDDYYLTEELPIPIRIGDRTLWVGNLTIETQNKFLDMFARVMALRGLDIINFETIQDGNSVLECIYKHKDIQKDLCKIISGTLLKQQWYYHEEVNGERTPIKLPKKIRYRYLKKRITGEKLAQIMVLIYKYNFDAEKKNFKILAEAMGVKRASETYIYSWLQNLAGLTGGFVKPQSAKSDSYQQELTKKIAEMDQDNKKEKIMRSDN